MSENEDCQCYVGDDGGFNLCRRCEFKIKERKYPEENKDVKLGKVFNPEFSTGVVRVTYRAY
jgi:hypothetical protein